MSLSDGYDWTEIEVERTESGVEISLYGGSEDQDDAYMSHLGTLEVPREHLGLLIEKLEEAME